MKLEGRRVINLSLSCCQNRGESLCCDRCGLTGAEIAQLRKQLPATYDHLKLRFPAWTGEGAVVQ